MSKLGMAVNFAGGALAAVCCTVFGGWDLWLKALLFVIVLDYATGVLGAWVQGVLDSRVGFKGICKKLVILCMAALAVQLDTVFGTGQALRGVAMGFYIANDALSIVENAAVIGVPVPQGLVDKLEQLKGESGE